MSNQQPTSVAELETKIAEMIHSTIRPLIERDGGVITFHSFADGVVYVQLSGACQSCAAVSLTLKAGVERTLRKAFREVHSVQQWNA